MEFRTISFPPRWIHYPAAASDSIYRCSSSSCGHSLPKVSPANEQGRLDHSPRQPASLLVVTSTAKGHGVQLGPSDQNRFRTKEGWSLEHSCTQTRKKRDRRVRSRAHCNNPALHVSLFQASIWALNRRRGDAHKQDRKTERLVNTTQQGRQILLCCPAFSNPACTTKVVAPKVNNDICCISRRRCHRFYIIFRGTLREEIEFFGFASLQWSSFVWFESCTKVIRNIRNALGLFVKECCGLSHM